MMWLRPRTRSTSQGNYYALYAFVSCGLDYCNSLLYGVADGQIQRLQSDRNTAARLVSGTWRSEHITPILKSLTWLPIRQRITLKLVTLVQNCMNSRAPVYLADDCQLASRRQTRSATAGCGISRCTANVDLTRFENVRCCWAAYIAQPFHYHSQFITVLHHIQATD